MFNSIQITKYTIVGLLNFILTFIIFTVLLKLIGISYLISLFIAWVIGMFFSYIINFLWVFKPEEKIVFNHRFIKFLSVGIVSITLNMIALNYIVNQFIIDPLYSQFIIMPFIVVFNYIFTKYWSLKNIYLDKGV
jgi:putative flippase GtrA